MMPKVEKIDFLCTATEKKPCCWKQVSSKNIGPATTSCCGTTNNYILFCLSKNHPFPALRLTRKVLRDELDLFGPFTSALAARETKRVIDRLFPLRKCRDTVMASRVRPCLQYHIGRCLGPCYCPCPKRNTKPWSGRWNFSLGKIGRTHERPAHGNGCGLGPAGFEQAAAARQHQGLTEP